MPALTYVCVHKQTMEMCTRLLETEMWKNKYVSMSALLSEM